MKTSTEIGSASRIIGEEKAVEYVAKAGFDAWDFSIINMFRYDYGNGTVKICDHPFTSPDYLAFARKLKKIGDDNGIVCNQSHAPFPIYCAEIRSYLKRAIECTAEAGGKICIIHPDNYKSAEENAEMYNELIPFAKSYGVKIATENMFNWNSELDQSDFAACATPKSFCEHINFADGLVACLDIGHSEMKGCNTSAVEMIKALGDNLQALHIHDNDHRYDKHQIPFSMDIDFYPIVKALKEINYKGYFTLEADKYLGAYNEDNIFSGICNLSNSAKKLVQMYENV